MNIHFIPTWAKPLDIGVLSVLTCLMLEFYFISCLRFLFVPFFFKTLKAMICK